jgi:hypothetical protein
MFSPLPGLILGYAVALLDLAFELLTAAAVPTIGLIFQLEAAQTTPLTMMPDHRLLVRAFA